MPRYTVYFELYGKKMKVKDIKAGTESGAKQEVMKAIKFHKIEEEFNEGDIFDMFKEIFS